MWVQKVSSQEQEASKLREKVKQLQQESAQLAFTEQDLDKAEDKVPATCCFLLCCVLLQSAAVLLGSFNKSLNILLVCNLFEHLTRHLSIRSNQIGRHS